MLGRGEGGGSNAEGWRRGAGALSDGRGWAVGASVVVGCAATSGHGLEGGGHDGAPRVGPSLAQLLAAAGSRDPQVLFAQAYRRPQALALPKGEAKVVEVESPPDDAV